MRLQGGTKYAGRVEVCYLFNGTYQWLTVCSIKWGLTETIATCRQLNYTNNFTVGEFSNENICIKIVIA